MANDKKPKLTMDQLVRYHIQVPGHLNQTWSGWFGVNNLEPDFDGIGSPVTSMTGLFDQTSLIGLLRRLNSLGLPLISVDYLEEV